MPEITEDEVLQVIARIERGEVGVACESGWGIAWTIIEFRTTDGWTFFVYNDGGQWDYVEDVESADGRSFDACGAGGERLHSYVPRTLEACRRWGLSEEDAATLLKFS